MIYQCVYIAINNIITTLPDNNNNETKMIHCIKIIIIKNANLVFFWKIFLLTNILERRIRIKFGHFCFFFVGLMIMAMMMMMICSHINFYQRNNMISFFWKKYQMINGHDHHGLLSINGSTDQPANQPAKHQ